MSAESRGRGDDGDDGGRPAVERRARPQGQPWSPGSLPDTLAFQDDLTGLYNRRLLTRLFDEGWRDLLAAHGGISVIAIDLDGFKQVNDVYGHLAGDRVLQEVAAILRGHFRDGDVVVRYGGDEFVVVLPGAGREDAGRLADRAREAIVSHEFKAPGAGETIRVPLSFSMGVASGPADGETGERVLAAADGRLYAEKRGRRRSFWKVHPGLILGGAVAVVALALVAGRLLPGPRTGASAAPRPPGQEPRPSASADGARAALEAHIRQLEEKLDELSRALQTQEQPAPREAEYETTIRELQRQIQQLQERAESPGDGPRPPVEPGEGSAAAVASPEPRVRAEQEQPIVSHGPASPEPQPAVTATDDDAPSPLPPPILTRPILVRFARPAYPSLAERLRKEATVAVRVLVDESGRATRADLEGPRAGYGFDDAARDAALRAVYRPGMRNGKPVRMETVVSVRFELRGGS